MLNNQMGISFAAAFLVLNGNRFKKIFSYTNVIVPLGADEDLLLVFRVVEPDLVEAVPPFCGIGLDTAELWSLGCLPSGPSPR